MIGPPVYEESRIIIKTHLKVNVPGLKFNEHETVSLFVRDDQRVPAVATHT